MIKKLLFATFLTGSAMNLNAQITIFEDSFETYTDFAITNVGSWLTLDLDGSSTYAGGGDFEWPNRFLPQAFIVFNPTTAQVTNNATLTALDPEVRNFDPKTGAKYMASWAAVMPGDGAGGSGPNNDFLVSPSITLGSAGNQLKFWVKSLSSTYGLETYKVAVYTGTGTPASATDFTVISGAANLTAPYGTWQEKTFDLSAYTGQTIRIAIQNTSIDRYCLLVDDFKVTATALSTDDYLASKFSVYPNPTNGLVTISNDVNSTLQSVTVSDLNGRTVKTLKLNGESTSQINISDLAAGVYMMNIASDQGAFTKKIVKN